MDRTVRQYHAIRDELIRQMGGKCAICGSEYKLHIDHIYGRDWEPREVSSHMRVRRYCQEFARGLIRLLCESCNCSNKH